MGENATQEHGTVPALLYDGADIDVLWDGHDNAVDWYRHFFGWDVQQMEDWKPDPRASQGRMTHMGHGVWLESVITDVRLPFHYAERGTVDAHVRWCLKTRNLKEMAAQFQQKGIRHSAIYEGPDSRSYLDVWCTAEGTRITIVEDSHMTENGVRDACVRIGVHDLERAVKWYQRYIGMTVEAVHPDQGYAVLKLGVNHHPEQSHTWILERLPGTANRTQVDGPVRPRCFIPEREAFFHYHAYLRANGICAGEIGGFIQRGYTKFHFYDPDGNRFNVCTF